jgi:hypothetical protein
LPTVGKTWGNIYKIKKSFYKNANKFPTLKGRACPELVSGGGSFSGRSGYSPPCKGGVAAKQTGWVLVIKLKEKTPSVFWQKKPKATFPLNKLQTFN